MSEKFLRYVDRADTVLLEDYPVVGRTPSGVWLDVWGERKFVLTTHGMKRFARPTEPEARTSFLARKRRQLGILRAQIVNIESAIKRLEANEIGTHYTSFDL